MASRQPTNCFICKNTWLGVGPICDDCNPKILKAAKAALRTPPPLICSYCQGNHDTADCLLAALASMGMPTICPYCGWNHTGSCYNMAYRNRRPRFMHPNFSPQRSMKFCPNCKGNYLIESKAGSVCSNCKTLVHNPCRNCNSTNTHGLKSHDSQFIECQDCQFIE